MSPLIKSSCSYAIRQYICMPPIIRSIFCPSSGLLYRIDTTCHHVYMLPAIMSICRPPQVNMSPLIRPMCCLPSALYAARHFVHMPPAIMSIGRLPLSLYAAFHHVDILPANMFICRPPSYLYAAIYQGWDYQCYERKLQHFAHGVKEQNLARQAEVASSGTWGIVNSYPGLLDPSIIIPLASVIKCTCHPPSCLYMPPVIRS